MPRTNGRPYAARALEIAALILVSLNLRHTVTAVSPVLETIRTDLELSRTAAALLTTVPVACMGIIAPFAGYLSAWRSAETMVLWGVLLIAVVTALRACGDLGMLLATALLGGCGIALVSPLLGAFIKHHFPEQTVTMTGVYAAATAAGAGLAAGLTAPLRAVFDSWRLGLAFWAVPAFLAAAVWWLMMRKSSSPPIDPPDAAKSLAMPWREPRAWGVLLLFGLQSQLFYCLVAWLAPMYIDLGWSETRAGGLVSLILVCQLAAMLVIAWAANRRPDRRPWLYLCTVACLIGFLGLATLPLAAPSTWIVLVGIGTGGLFPLATALPLDYARTPADAASWSAMMLFGGYLLSASGPLLGGVVVDATGSYATVFGIMTASSALLLAVCYGMKPPQRRAGTAA